MDWIEGKGYKKRILAGEAQLGRGNIAQIVRIWPGQKVKPHHHRQQTELFYILEGMALLSIAGREVEAGPGDVYLCKPGDIHSVKNNGTGDFEILVFKTGWKEDDSYW
ncbi:MAG: cupin domain-containing protein [Candidatus Hydrothermarchaeaceae archaeon]